jgi:1-acyl-sn-glycerol-3-phosphate acyltransferase
MRDNPRLQTAAAETIGFFLDRMNLKIVGEEHFATVREHLVSKSGGVVVMSNHESIADYAVFREVRKRVPDETPVVAPWAEKFLGAEMGPWGMIGQAMGAMDRIELIGIPQTASSENMRKLITAINDMGEAVREGGVVCFFPQGTRSRSVGMIRAKSGIATKLFKDEQIKAQTLILPVAVEGTRKIHEPNTKRVNPFAKVKMTAGEPFFYKDAEAGAKACGVGVTDIFMWKIGSMLPPEYEGEYKEIFEKIRNSALPTQK